MHGGAGNDTFTGGIGNDSLAGEDGTDTAVFAGKIAEFGISQNADGSLRWSTTPTPMATRAATG